MDSDDDSDYGDVVTYSLEDNEDSVLVASDTSEKESYYFESEEQHTQNMQELKNALDDQRNEYKKISHYMQMHRTKHPQLSVCIIDKLEVLMALFKDIEPQIDLEILIGINIGLWPKIEKIIKAHDEHTWIFDWYKQEQHLQSSTRKRTLLKALNLRKKT